MISLPTTRKQCRIVLPNALLTLGFFFSSVKFAQKVDDAWAQTLG